MVLVRAEKGHKTVCSSCGHEIPERTLYLMVPLELATARICPTCVHGAAMKLERVPD